jgi:hypothetical protein
VRERAAGDVGEDLFHDGVAAVLSLGLDELEGESVKTAWCRQAENSSPWPRAAFLFWSRTRRTISRAVTARFFFDANAVYRTSATSASEIQQPSWSSQTACGYLMAVQFSSGMPAMAARVLLFMGAVTENRASWRRIALAL